MKYIITVFLAVCLSGVSQAGLKAQNINQNRMNRDINIMEGVLGKLFKTDYSGDNGSMRITRIHMSKGNYTWNPNKNTEIKGTYLPSYGVLFSIRGSKPLIFSENSSKDDYYFVNAGNDKEKVPVNKKTIVNQMIDFLENYGATINQLNSEEKITVTYKSDDYNKLIKITGDPTGKIKNNRLPAITVTGRMSDIKAYQTNNLSSRAFRNRLDINSSKSDIDEKSDLKIFSNILETAFEDQGDKQFNISNDIEYQQIDNLGVLYSFDISYGGIFSSLNFNKDEIVNFTKGMAEEADLDSLDFDMSLDSLKAKHIISTNDSALVIRFDSTYFRRINQGMKNLKVKISSLSDALDKTSQEIDEARRKRKTDIQNALDQFMTKLEGYILKYGRTLNSIKSNHYLMLAVGVNTSIDDISERTVLQIKKSVLEALSKGRINREQAMDKIDVRKY